MSSDLSNAASQIPAMEDRSSAQQLPRDVRGPAANWQTACEALREGMLILDLEGRIVQANAAAAAFLGRPVEQLLGGHYASLLYGTDCSAAGCPVHLTLRTSQFAETECFQPASNSWLLISSAPIRDPAGQLTGAVCLARSLAHRTPLPGAYPTPPAGRASPAERLPLQTGCFQGEMVTPQHLREIVGQSPQMQRVLYQVEQVAPTTSSVLIEGETGTGKELIAQLVHNLSPRKQRLMIKVNCAALPAALVESELFGREKGAYTGALTRQPGRFELADSSTIFLDEIAELSLEVQVKLLRVLQEGQFERLGSPKALKVDVRLIAATNRNLREEVHKGRFREDLFYRLNVFPIQVPPLRERAEDLPLLVWTFVEEFGSRMGKRITKIPRQTMEALQRYSWPGNIRELRNVIEHGVIISPSETLRVPPLDETDRTFPAPMSLAEVEREHILQTLELTGWRIKGPKGAAARLGLKPSTLYTRMQKHGIPTRRQREESLP